MRVQFRMRFQEGVCPQQKRWLAYTLDALRYIVVGCIFTEAPPNWRRLNKIELNVSF